MNQPLALVIDDEPDICELLTLTLGRMIPVWFALLGSGLRLPTVAFIGWVAFARVGP